MAAEKCRQIKAVLFIFMLAGAEASHVQQKILLHTGGSLQSGTSPKKTTVASADGGILAEQEKRFVEQIKAMKVDPNDPAQQKHVAQQMEAIMDDPDFQEKAKLVVNHIEAKLSANFQEQAKLVAEQMEAILSDPKTTSLAEQMKAVMASPILQKQQKYINEPMKAVKTIMADPSFKEQAKDVAKQTERMLTDPKLRQQANFLFKHMEAMLADLNLQDLVKLFAQQMKRMKSPNFQEQAKRIAEQMQTMLEDPEVWPLHHSNLGSTMELTSNHAVDAHNSKDNMIDKMFDNTVDKMFDRALKASPVPYADMDRATLGKPSDLAVPTSHRSSYSALWPAIPSGLALPHRYPGLRRGPLVVHAKTLGERLDRVGSAVDRLPPAERKAVETAVQQLGGRVTVGDVAAKAGVPLTAAEQALQALALDSEGALEVSGDGKIVYALPGDFQSRVAGKSLRSRIEPVTEKAGQVLGTVTRVGFGTCLLASLAIIGTALLVISSSSSRDERDDRRRDDGFGGGGGMFFGPRFYFSPFDIYYMFSPSYYDTQRQNLREGKEMDFLSSIFSVVFGDGNPNDDLEERRWEAVAESIVQRDGVVTAEELAPFLDGPGADVGVDDDGAALKEGYVLEALQRFDGEPVVNDDGYIFYRFPSLLTSAVGKASSFAGMGVGKLKERAQELGIATAGLFDRESIEEALAKAEGEGRRGATTTGVTPYLYEEPWKFTGASDGQKVTVGALGVLNFVGIVALNSQLADPRVLYNFVMASPGLAKLVVGVLPLLKVYAAFIVAFPLFRFFRNSQRNQQIEERNARRSKSAKRLQTDSALEKKRRAARATAKAQPVRQEVKKSDIVFDSSKEVDETKKKEDLDDFDKRLKERSDK